MVRTVRTVALIAAFGLVGVGLWRRNGISDGQWLALLAGAWLLSLFAVWPRRPRPRAAASLSIAKIGLLLSTVFVVLAVQLARIQVVEQAGTTERVATDPLSGEVIANPRLVNEDLRIDRGRIVDRNGEPIANTIVENGIGRRIYPDPATAYVAGYYSPLLYGKSGLEATFDDELRGEEGQNLFTRIEDRLLHRSPQGLDLHLTLDGDLQRQADRLLDDRIGAVVLIDVKTGAVLALASNPHYDSEQLFTADAAERAAAAAYWQQLTDDADHPLVLRATDGLYTPGSTFKTITAAAAIDAGLASPDDTYRDDGSLDVDGHVIVEENRPDDTVDTWTLRQALAFSLNVVFAQVGLELGGDLLAEYAERFGFGENVPFDLPVAKSQVASSVDFLRSNPAIADTAFGQGELLVTPLQMAMVAATFANDGKMMRPYLVDRVTTRDGDVVREANPDVWRQPIAAGTAGQVRDMMVNAVENGYAFGASIDGLVVGGKSGTAETGTGAPHAWFIGFAGDPDPQYAVAVVLEHGGTGLTGPLEIAREMLASVMGVSS
ncbi:MAG: penicillin-binding protein [Thermomicrobiales bacterium]|jgi:peptidoglycan glycosyltransferase|nr:penicillin-binding protein [Thermomicrobiales bacterium]